jgi:hypothetical protein
MSKPTRRFLLTALIALSTLAMPGSANADVAEDPPSVTITSPQDGEMFEGAPVTIDVTLDVFQGDMGLDRIELRVDDATVGMLTEAPWTFSGVQLDEGMHGLVAVAIIPGGDEFPSPAVNVAVFPSSETGDGTGSDTGTGTETAGDTGNDEAGETGNGSGGGDEGGKCSVTTSTSLGGGAALVGFMMLGLAGIRRRR